MYLFTTLNGGRQTINFSFNKLPFVVFEVLNWTGGFEYPSQVSLRHLTKNRNGPQKIYMYNICKLNIFAGSSGLVLLSSLPF